MGRTRYALRMPALADAEQKAWSEVAAATGATFAGTTLVRGSGARQVAEALVALGGSTVVAEEAVIDPDRADPPEDSVDTVVLLHAWASSDQVDAVARAATDWLRPGGWLLMAELDTSRLFGASPRLYPSAALYQMFPEVASRLRRRCADGIFLSKAAIRAGLDHKVGAWVDRPLAGYDSPSELVAAIEFGAWRGLEHLDADDYASLLTAVGDVARDEWPMIELEPWLVVGGASRV